MGEYAPLRGCFGPTLGGTRDHSATWRVIAKRELITFQIYDEGKLIFAKFA
uniref:Uncharacterized protein n=1 Tax=Rhizobium rhizogenes TaxID=359 RepID=A0A7S4ZU56_RHIRH|nr:hypothetical protein pC5.8a_166 [Rhizobium rhizogenes]